jgi:hypothetical protein
MILFVHDYKLDDREPLISVFLSEHARFALPGPTHIFNRISQFELCPAYVEK